MSSTKYMQYIACNNFIRDVTAYFSRDIFIHKIFRRIYLCKMEYDFVTGKMYTYSFFIHRCICDKTSP